MTHVPYPPSRILVPMDFSRTSRAALAYAVKLAAATDARVELLHAGSPMPHVPPDVPMPKATAQAAEVMTGMLRERERAGRSRLIEIAAEFLAVSAVVHWREGEPSECIERTANERGVDLIVMGTHGRSGISRALLGSVAERTMRRCPCPVLLVRAPEDDDAPLVEPTYPPRTVVAPTDFSDGSAAGVRYAAHVADEAGCALRLLHVLPGLQGVPASWPTPAAHTVLQEMAATHRANVQLLLEETAGRHAPHATTRIRHGSDAEQVVSEAEASDLIVIASHGRSGARRLILGSVAERVARLAPCPVLIVKTPRA